MSSLYVGQAANASSPAVMTVTSVTNANPAIVTVAGSLTDLLSGNKLRVRVQDVGGATGVNGQWDATVLTSSSFSVPVAAGGSYTSGGTAQALDLGPLTLISDGDEVNAANLNTSGEGIADQVSLLAASTGAYKLAKVFKDIQTGLSISWASSSTSAVTPGSATLFTTPGPTWSVPGVVAGDIVEAELNSAIEFDRNGNSLSAPVFVLLYSPLAYGLGYMGRTGPLNFFAANGAGANATLAVPIVIRQVYVAPTSGTATFQLATTIESGTLTSPLLFWAWGDYSFTVKIYRPTGIAQ